MAPNPAMARLQIKNRNPPLTPLNTYDKQLPMIISGLKTAIYASMPDQSPVRLPHAPRPSTSSAQVRPSHPSHWPHPPLAPAGRFLCFHLLSVRKFPNPARTLLRLCAPISTYMRLYGSKKALFIFSLSPLIRSAFSNRLGCPAKSAIKPYKPNPSDSNLIKPGDCFA